MSFTDHLLIALSAFVGGYFSPVSRAWLRPVIARLRALEIAVFGRATDDKAEEKGHA